VWTELGKGLAGALDMKGAEPGLLRRIVTRWCLPGGPDEAIDLARWLPRIEPPERMTVRDAGRTVLDAKLALEEVVAATLGDAPESDRDRLAFQVVARGWFPSVSTPRVPCPPRQAPPNRSCGRCSGRGARAACPTRPRLGPTWARGSTGRPPASTDAP